MRTNHLKYSLWIFLFIGMVGFSCNKENNHPPEGFVLATFTGPDLTMGPCSGGYFFTINDTIYRAFDIVQNSIVTAQTKFPVTAWIKYEKPAGGCYDYVNKLVKITAIQDTE